MSGVLTASTVGTALAYGATTALAGALLAPKAPNVQAPEPPPKPQAAVMPDQRAGRQGAATNPATLLTGAQGVALGSGQLGKNTLLGG